VKTGGKDEPETETDNEGSIRGARRSQQTLRNVKPADLVQGIEGNLLTNHSSDRTILPSPSGP
jgi:hypothetical protein